jgi:hypothetical protein
MEWKEALEKNWRKPPHPGPLLHKCVKEREMKRAAFGAGEWPGAGESCS